MYKALVGCCTLVAMEVAKATAWMGKRFGTRTWIAPRTSNTQRKCEGQMDLGRGSYKYCPSNGYLAKNVKQVASIT